MFPTRVSETLTTGMFPIHSTAKHPVWGWELIQQHATGPHVVRLRYICQDHREFSMRFSYIESVLISQNKWNTALIGLVTYYREAVISEFS